MVFCPGLITSLILLYFLVSAFDKAPEAGVVEILWSHRIKWCEMVGSPLLVRKSFCSPIAKRISIVLARFNECSCSQCIKQIGNDKNHENANKIF